MLLGITVTPWTVAGLGITMGTLILIQVAMGMRWIRIQGKLHWQIHKWLGWTIVGIGVIHALFGLTILGIIRLP